MSGASACSRSARVLAPVRTPATIAAPARRPDSMSLAVSPATASSLTAPPPSRSRAVSEQVRPRPAADRKSTRLNSSHLGISYAVFCLKKKKKTNVKTKREKKKKRIKKRKKSKKNTTDNENMTGVTEPRVSLHIRSHNIDCPGTVVTG